MIRTIPRATRTSRVRRLLRRNPVNTATRLAHWKCAGRCASMRALPSSSKPRSASVFTNQFRVEIQNPLNRTVFGNPTMDFTSAAFGRISSTQIGPRNIQLGMKLIF